MTLIIVFAEAVLALRTWAVWGRDKLVGIGLGSITLTHLVLQCYVANRVTNSFVFSTPPYRGFRGCFVTHTDTIASINYAAAAVVEAIVLVLMIISASRFYRHGRHTELVNVVHVDGILFYIYLLALNAMNLGFVFAMPPDLMISMSPIEISMYAVLTCRIVLNIRAVDNNGIQSDLHTTFHELPESILPVPSENEDV